MTSPKQGTLAVLLGWALSAAAQTSAPAEKDDLFAGTEKFAQGASSVTQIDMDPETLGKVEGKDGLRAHRTLLSVVHTYEYDKPGMYKIEDVEAFRKKLETGAWHCSVHIREAKTGESTDICNKHRDDGLREQAIITVEPKSLTFIHTIGNSRLSVPLGMSFMAPEMKVEMAIMQAELHTDMAAMQPEMRGLFLQMNEFRGPDPEEMRRLRRDLRPLGDLNPSTSKP